MEKEDIQQIEMSLEMLKATVTHVENLVALLGSTQDNPQLRTALDTAREEAKQLERNIFLKLSSMRLQQNHPIVSKFNKTKEKWKILYRDSYQREKVFVSISNCEIQPKNVNLLPQQTTKRYTTKQEILKEIVQERNQAVQGLKKDMTEVADLFSKTAKLAEYQRPMMDVIETQVEETQEQTTEGVQNLAKAAKDQAVSLPVSGAAVGGVVGGGLGLILGPLGVVIGSTTGATVGSMVGKSIGQMQKDIVDKEMFEHHLKDKWINDERVIKCMLCHTEFTSMIRKHHCRACGGIFCWQCSDKKLAFKLPNFESERMERVCRTCFQESWMLKPE